MKNEPWWGHANEDGKNNLRSMLLYLIDVLREKDRDSYESACNYVVEIFRYEKCLLISDGNEIVCVCLFLEHMELNRI